MSTQETNHSRVDPATRFWTSDHSTPAEEPGIFDDLDDDVKHAAREAGARSADADEIEASLDSLETLSQGFGTVKRGLEFGQAMTQFYKADPISARDFHKEQYLKQPPKAPATKPKAAEPPDDLDDAGRDEWHLRQCARDAFQTTERNGALRQEIEEAKPLLAALRQRHGSIKEPVDFEAAVHQAMLVNPQVSDRISFMCGAPATPAAAQAAQQNAVAAQQLNYERASVSQLVEEVIRSGSMPGLEQPEVQMEVVKQVNAMKARGEPPAPSYYDELAVGYNRAMSNIRAARDRATADRARNASRSISGGPSLAPESNDKEDDDDIVEVARQAYRKAMAA